jgi:hypothetical protein
MDKKEILRLCDFMQLAEIESIDWMLAGSNHVFVINMEYGGREIKSVYKPRNGEAPLWDFPDGTLYMREYATFLLSMEIGWYFVPPTIVRQGLYGIGSMQYMVEIPKRTGQFGDVAIAISELKKIVIFDYLVNNADRKISHLLKDKYDRFWLVDHGLTFNAVPKLRTVFWDFAGQNIPKQLIADVKALRDKLKKGGDFREKLLQLLDKEEIEALDFRINQLLKKAIFPHPDSPWSVPFPWY